MLPRPIHSHVDLVRDAKAAAIIVAPHSEPWNTLAKQAAEVVHDWTGVQLQCVTPESILDKKTLLFTDEAKKQSLIFIGNIAVNPAFLQPYVRRLLVVDELSPGSAALQTQPNALGNGKGLVLVGGSLPEHAQGALELFKTHGKSALNNNALSLPRLWLPGPDLLFEGTPRYARLTGPTPAPWVPGLYREDEIHIGYDIGRQIHEATAITDLGIFDEQQVNQIEQQMLDLVLTIPNRVWWYGSSNPRNGKVGGLHENFKNTRLLLVIEYLLTIGSPDDEAREKLIAMRPQIYQHYDYILTHAYRNDHEGVESSWALSSFIWHVLSFGQMQYFDSGRARDAVFHSFLETDNMGGAAVHAQYGHKNIPNYPTEFSELLNAAAWGLRDGRLRWLAENMPYSLKTKYGFPLRLPINDLPLQRPDEWLGVQFQPLSEHSYDSSQVDPRWTQPEASREQTADLMVFRSGFTPDAQYLAIDAFQNHFQPLGLGSVLRYTDQGKLWLVSHTGVEGNYDKSGLAVSRGAMERDDPAVGEPWGAKAFGAQDDDFGYGSLLSESYHDTDWTRHILWKKGEYFVFFDEVRARCAGQFALTTAWRTLHPARMEEGRWTQRLDDSVCTVQSPQALAVRAGREPEQRYESERVPFLLRQSVEFHASQEGDRKSIINLLCTRDHKATPPEIRELSDHVAIVLMDGELAVYGCRPWRFEGLEIDAKAFILTRDGVRLTDGSATLEGTLIVESSDPDSQSLSHGKWLRPENAGLLQRWWDQAGGASSSTSQAALPALALTQRWACDRLEPVSAKLYPHRSGGRLVSGSWQDTEHEGAPREGLDWWAEFDESTEIDKVSVVIEIEQVVGGERWPEFGSSPGAPIPIPVDQDVLDHCILKVDGEPREAKARQQLVGPIGKSFFREQKTIAFQGGRTRRIELNVPRDLPVYSVDLQGPKNTPAEVVQLHLLDPRDGSVLALTADHQMLCIEANGQTRWFRRFDEKVLCVTLLGCDDDRRVVVSDAACGLWQIGLDGEVLKHDILGQSDDSREFIDQGIIKNRVYSIGTWRQPGVDEDTLFFGSYQSAAWLKPDGKVDWLAPDDLGDPMRRGYAWRGLIYWDRVLPQGMDLNGDGVVDQAFLGRGYATPPSLILFSGATHKPYAEIPLTNGRTLHLSAVQLDDACRITAVNSFQAIVCDGSGKLHWSRKFDTPASTASVHESDLYVSKDDGVVLRFDSQGNIVAQATWDAGITDMIVTDHYVCAVGPLGIFVSNHQFTEVRHHAISANRVLSSGESSLVVATTDGRIVMLDMAVD